MGFGAEMKDFSAGFESGMKIGKARADIRKARAEAKTAEGPNADDLAAIPDGGTGGAKLETKINSPDTSSGAPASGGGKGATGDEVAWKDASPEQKALLNTIAGPESGGRYNVIYGGGTFNDFKDHPRQDVRIRTGPNANRTSSAAGKYQFIGSTWDRIAKAYHLDDFSPENQDKAAWYLATEEYGKKTGRDLSTDLKSGDPKIIAGIGPALKGQWTSLPGGIEQGTNTDKFVSTFDSQLKKFSDPNYKPTDTAATPAAAPAAAAPAKADANAPVLPEDTVGPVAGNQFNRQMVDQAPATKSAVAGWLDADTAKQVDPNLLRVAERARKDNPDLFALNPRTKTIRSEADQKEMVDKGWSKTMKSKHREGKALDLVPINPDTKQPDPDYKVGYSKIAEAMRRAAQQEGVNVEWGGDWKSFKDQPHWQVSQLEQQQLEGGGAMPPNPNDQSQPTMFAATGGVIPEPAYADGGTVNPAGDPDKYNAARAYTQAIPQTTGTAATPRKIKLSGSTADTSGGGTTPAWRSRG